LALRTVKEGPQKRGAKKKEEEMALNMPAAFSQVVKKGAMVVVRTVTLYYVGEVAEIDGLGILLKNAAWIADQGEMSQSLLTGQVKEFDFFPDPVYVFTGAGVDVTTWRHAPLKGGSKK
jgi:hypothetical protein